MSYPQKTATAMDSELIAASSFLSSFLPSTPSTGSFTHSLHSLLAQRYDQHWHPSDPERGSAFRSIIRSSTGALDATLLAAAEAVQLPELELDAALRGGEGKVWLGSSGWTLWVDPGCVSLRIEGGGGRETGFVEIWGHLPEGLKSRVVPMDKMGGGPSFNYSTTTPTLSPRRLVLGLGTTGGSPTTLEGISSPRRSSHAIQILRPTSLLGALRPSSPLPIVAPKPVLCASPFVTPPTPLRPSSVSSSSSTEEDVFGTSALALALPITLSTRPSSRSSNSSSISSSTDLEPHFNDSTESLSSSLTSTSSSSYHKIDGQFSYTAQRGFTFPPTGGASSGPSGVFYPRSLPASPTKPRRRGTRGGSSSSHSPSSSISGALPTHSASSSITSISSVSVQRTREQALQGTLTEHSGGKVGVLGGGVLLGLAGGAAGRGEKRRGGSRKRWGPEGVIPSVGAPI